MPRVSVPCRVDLAGGTLDIWPLSQLFSQGCTVNVAVSAFVELEGSFQKGEFTFQKGKEVEHFTHLSSVLRSSYGLYGQLFQALEVEGFYCHILKEPPPGSGLGASSALLLGLYILIHWLREEPLDRDRGIQLLKDVEVRHLGYPTGMQDYLPGWEGGVLRITYPPGSFQVKKLTFPREWQENLSFYYTGIPHHSGALNWQIVKKVIEGDEQTTKGLNAIADIASMMAEKWDALSPKDLGVLMDEEWQERKTLDPAIAPDELLDLEEVFKEMGVWGIKAAGAAGGGTLILIHPKKIKKKLYATHGQKGAFLDIQLYEKGFVVW